MHARGITHWLSGPRAARLPRGLTLLLAALLLYQLARLTWLLVPAPATEPAALPSEAPPPVAAAPAPLERIADWHLFGAAERPAPVRAAPIDAPETRLKLVLHGVFASTDPAQARAIIAAPNGSSKIYRVGDTLPGGAELSEIHPDRVILQRGGRYETLRLPRERRGGAVAAPTPAVDRASELLREYRSRMLSNPRSLGELLRPVPYRENDRFGGYRLYPGSRPELFRQLGLRPGDLVTEVNGIPLDSAARAMEVLKGLRESDQLQLHIRRGRREMDLSFRLS
ncbi:type II secretion system protein GspC [Thiohalobacter sp. IOR34]|uniref:type II secretion system protein GspC n=1 Tax=Thiohalobacter sp. IOR34 TaxID=3057176 RepID=UPI0025B09C87|nr:type II secretion system protein GspC [Thiohalobacter sp. IOR34]WJW75180.1 type II secretion system protein GspC [Thiohalobacter sp. IOR34]